MNGNVVSGFAVIQYDSEFTSKCDDHLTAKWKQRHKLASDQIRTVILHTDMPNNRIFHICFAGVVRGHIIVDEIGRIETIEFYDCAYNDGGCYWVEIVELECQYIGMPIHTIITQGGETSISSDNIYKCEG